MSVVRSGHRFSKMAAKPDHLLHGQSRSGNHRLEVSSEDPDEIVNCVKLLGKSWGGMRRVVPIHEALRSPLVRYSGLAHSSASPEKQLAVELTRRELCSGQCRRTRCHWPRVDSQPVVQAL